MSEKSVSRILIEARERQRKVREGIRSGAILPQKAAQDTANILEGLLYQLERAIGAGPYLPKD